MCCFCKFNYTQIPHFLCLLPLFPLRYPFEVNGLNLRKCPHETAIKKKEEIERDAREKALNIAADEELKEYIINKYPNKAQFIYQKFKSKQPFIGANQDEIKFILGEADTIDSQGLWKYGDLGPRGGGRKWKYVLRALP